MNLSIRRRLPGQEVLARIHQAGYGKYLTNVDVQTKAVYADIALVALSAMLTQLREDKRFKQGNLHAVSPNKRRKLHKDVGKNLTEFRSHTNEIGKGSMQYVIDVQTGRFYADIDKASPYTDVWSQIVHTGEVIEGFWGKVKRLFS